jgi:hypothetical protein
MLAWCSDTPTLRQREACKGAQPGLPDATRDLECIVSRCRCRSRITGHEQGFRLRAPFFHCIITMHSYLDGWLISFLHLGSGLFRLSMSSYRITFYLLLLQTKMRVCLQSRFGIRQTSPVPNSYAQARSPNSLYDSGHDFGS